MRIVRPTALGLAVGLVFAVARTVASTLVGAATGPELLRTFAIEAAAGCVVGWSLVALGARLRVSLGTSAFVLASVLFVSVLAVMIEGAAYEPAAVPVATLLASAALQLVVAALIGLVAARLVGGRARGGVAAVPRRSPLAWLARYAASALVYVALYFVTGALNFTLVTGPYYRSGAAGLVVPDPAVVLAVAAIEGALLPIAVVPLAYTFKGSRRARAVAAGTSLFVLGGIVPLILAPSLPLFLRVASAVEILFQKLPAGAASAMLLGPED